MTKESRDIIKKETKKLGRGPRTSSFWVPRNLFHPMIRQARTGDTVLVKSKEMTGGTQTLPW
jgi:hypothetical protein